MTLCLFLKRQNTWLMVTRACGLCAALGASWAWAQLPSAGQDSGRKARIVAESLARAADLQALDGRVPPLLEQMKSLRDELDTLQPPPAKPPEKSKPEQPLQVMFRPPFTKITEKKPTLGLVFENQRVSVLNIDAIDKALEAHIKQGGFPTTDGKVAVPGEPFDVEYSVLNLGTFRMLQLKLVRKAGQDGETMEQFHGSGGAARRAVEGTSAADSYCQCVVYPDSFDIFRSVRSELWKKKFQVRFLPMPSGEPIRMGGGGGKGTAG